MSAIGWYVHHHGAGHLHRFLAVRDRMPEVVALSSLPRPESVPEDRWIELPLDVPAGTPAAVDPTAGGALHWAPLHCDGLRERAAIVSAWIAAARPAALVVDVSCEIALLARLHGVPTVVVAQRGRRTDPAHQLAYATAAAVAAPWTETTDLPDCGLPIDKTTFVGALSRFDDRPFAAADPSGRDVLLLVGSGGHEIDPQQVRTAIDATPEWRWTIAGALRIDHPRAHDAGPRADVAALLDRSTVVVATAGGNAVAEVAAARRPLIALPQERPFEEQRLQAEALQRAGLATSVTAWPDPADWPVLLRTTATREEKRWRLLHDGKAAERLTRLIRAVADADRAGGARTDGARRQAGAGCPQRQDPPATAPITVATLQKGRLAHLANQARSLLSQLGPDDRYVIVTLEDAEGRDALRRLKPIADWPPHGPRLDIVPHPHDGGPLPLAAARNRAAEIATQAGAALLVMLDVDCIADDDLIARYREAHERTQGEGILTGPVGRFTATDRSRAHARAREPRPFPATPGEIAPQARPELFWSLSYALTPETHARIGGYDERYVGYGGEDTDFALRARRQGVPIWTVGGAWAHHQHHPVSSPPWEHLDEIVANARRFRARWGRWPMEGWLEAFAAAGAIDWDPAGDAIERRAGEAAAQSSGSIRRISVAAAATASSRS